MATALEDDGVPTVAVHTDRFAPLARTTASVNGYADLRQAYVPQPVVDKSALELRAYVDGDDPINGRRFTDVVVEGLTAPVVREADVGGSRSRRGARLLPVGSEEALRRRFEDERWTDFLPIVLPTEERVEEMLAGTSRDRHEYVGRLAPTAFREFWEYDVEKVAVNAVMAGCRPEYLPVILALASAGVTARSSSTNSFGTFGVVNGPIRHEIGMSSGIGAMGPFNHANATIGRAFSLLSQNLQGGSTPDLTYLGSQGNPYNYSAVWAENEEASPWLPYHVEHGAEPGASTVSVFLGCWYTTYGCGVRENWEETLRRCLDGGDPYLGPVLILDPLAARTFVEKGFDTKSELARWMSENSLRTAREFWDNQWIQTLIHPKALNGLEPFASYLDAAPDDLIAPYTPKACKVVVIGGETQPTWRIVAGRHSGKPTSVDEWR